VDRSVLGRFCGRLYGLSGDWMLVGEDGSTWWVVDGLVDDTNGDKVTRGGATGTGVLGDDGTLDGVVGTKVLGDDGTLDHGTGAGVLGDDGTLEDATGVGSLQDAEALPLGSISRGRLVRCWVLHIRSSRVWFELIELARRWLLALERRGDGLERLLRRPFPLSCVLGEVHSGLSELARDRGRIIAI